MVKALVGFLAMALLSATAGAAEPASAPVRVILVGDSTLARGSGYGDALCRHFTPEVACINAARGGRSTRSYREEGLWASVLQSLENAGDFSASYVLIQFGHNDPGQAGAFDQPDQADLLSARPDFVVLMYAALNMAVTPPGGAPRSDGHLHGAGRGDGTLRGASRRAGRRPARADLRCSAHAGRRIHSHLSSQ